MSAGTLSPKFQLVVPQRVRESMKLEPGTKFEVIHLDGRIKFVPIQGMKKMRGLLTGKLKNSDIEREDRDRL